MRSVSIKAGLGPNYVHGILKDGKDATVDRLLAICAALGVEPSAILGADVVDQAAGPTVPADEARLLEMFRRLTAEEKAEVLKDVRGRFPF